MVSTDQIAVHGDPSSTDIEQIKTMKPEIINILKGTPVQTISTKEQAIERIANIRKEAKNAKSDTVLTGLNAEMEDLMKEFQIGEHAPENAAMKAYLDEEGY